MCSYIKELADRIGSIEQLVQGWSIHIVVMKNFGPRRPLVQEIILILPFFILGSNM